MLTLPGLCVILREQVQRTYMDLQAYQDFLVVYSDTYRLPDSIANQTVRLGLMGESGEVVEWIKKSLRDGTTDTTALKAELGDVLAYFFLVLKDVGIYAPEISNVEYFDDIPLVCPHLYCAKALYSIVSTFLMWEETTQVRCAARRVLVAIKRIAFLYDIEFEDIVQYNWDKLSKRLAEGKQRGSGDNR